KPTCNRRFLRRPFRARINQPQLRCAQGVGSLMNLLPRSQSEAGLLAQKLVSAGPCRLIASLSPVFRRPSRHGRSLRSSESQGVGMRSTTALRCAVFVLSASFLFAPPERTTAEELLKARLAQNLGPISGLAIVANAKGIFAKQGLDISVSNFTSGKQCLDTVLGGGADIATTAEAPGTAAAMAQQPIAFVAGGGNFGLQKNH